MEIDNKEPAGGPMIHFGPPDAQGVHLLHNDALVIFAIVANLYCSIYLCDSGSFANVLFYKVYQQIELGDIPLELVDTSLYGFLGEVVHPWDIYCSPLEPTRRTRVVHFLVVDMSPAYNLILGQPALNTFQAIDSIYHMKLKFLVGDKVGEVKGDQYTTRKWYVEVIKSSNNRMEVDLPSKKSSRSATQQEDQRGVVPARVQPTEELLSIQLVSGEPDKITKIGSQLSPTLA
ncbi:UNVERIFIED_CONTAM: hypothetical protein Sradi_7111600 [Sesamum radiatum]|uniref:Uncharacterized protein n=1 Tax=Sesamum radiatum TaxID=300843 RepID=A0AAW2J029_SESRA